MQQLELNKLISIHALRGEGDDCPASCAQCLCRFQSTPSVGRATDVTVPFMQKAIFQSTPSVGRATAVDAEQSAEIQNFNPRPPWGGRREEDSCE